MTITLRFFASVREALGSSHETLSVPAGVETVGQLRSHLVARGAPWSEALGQQRALRMACDQIMCEAGTALREGCEVAFFPPVTGG
ncbi:MAG: molybdopterin converting factor subunit 1 [Pseudomonadota bacterium]